MKPFEKFLKIVSESDEEDKDYMLSDRIKTWHDLYYGLRESSTTKQERIDHLFNRYGDMIDYESCKQIYEIEEELLSSRISENQYLCEDMIKKHINILEYKNRILGKR